MRRQSRAEKAKAMLREVVTSTVRRRSARKRRRIVGMTICSFFECVRCGPRKRAFLFSSNYIRSHPLTDGRLVLPVTFINWSSMLL
jgi:hypothetical protein